MFFGVVAVEKARETNIRRIAEHNGNIIVIGNFPQNFGRYVRIDNNFLSACGQFDKLAYFYFNALLGHVVRPFPMLLGSHAEPFLPAAHCVKIAQSRLLPAGQLFTRESVVIILAAQNHTVPLGKHFCHGGFPRAAVSVDKVYISQIVFYKIIAYLYFHCCSPFIFT